jgi:hypothetical protein
MERAARQTKRIKNSINKIGEPIPSLRRHLAARIKTERFCSYNPQPNTGLLICFSSPFYWEDTKSHTVT